MIVPKIFAGFSQEHARTTKINQLVPLKWLTCSGDAVNEKPNAHLCLAVFARSI
jgi:hypothetical protein